MLVLKDDDGGYDQPVTIIKEDMQTEHLPL